jgi:hypothetical protein
MMIMNSDYARMGKKTGSCGLFFGAVSAFVCTD